MATTLPAANRGLDRGSEAMYAASASETGTDSCWRKERERMRERMRERGESGWHALLSGERL